MQRENYYIILELSIDPPEKDLQVIGKAIQSKKIEWSRLRNHPTKGLQIQKLINLIPDIENVMKDDILREKEAQAALDIVEIGKADKISELDGHIDILMGKGYIAKEDIIRLAEVHGISEEEINTRIANKKEAKYFRADQEISLKMGKGYITEAEIEKIARKNALGVDDLRKRVRCPILANEKDAPAHALRPLDKSIEKAINENLQVVGKKSLYDFLGVSESAAIEQLQEIAGKQKKILSERGKKDAIFTAGITLAGHCLTIFKNNETRLAYDVSLANAKLSSLDSDIKIASDKNKIRHEYFDVLIHKAMDYGMDKEEAAAYIRAFCQKKKIHIEKKPEKKRIVMLAAAASVMGLILLISAVFIFSRMHQQKLLKNEYNQLMQSVSAQAQAEQKLKLLKNYLSNSRENEFSDTVKKRIAQIELEINKKELANIQKTADQLIESGKLNEAMTFLNETLGKAGLAKSKKAIRQKMEAVSVLIEKRDFETVLAVSLEGSPDQKIRVFQNYLKTHPKGKNKDKVKAFISEISNEYFNYIKKILGLYETQAQWEASLALCQNYIAIYDNSNSDQLKPLLAGYEKKIREEKVYTTLVEKAKQMGTNYTAALQMFKEYKEAYPQSSIKHKIDNSIEQLKGLITKQNIQQATDTMREKIKAGKGRFIEKASGVVMDTRNCLIWCLLDSDMMAPNICMTYEKGKSYVDSLSTGGFSDWRLPTSAELKTLFTLSPAFPVTEKKKTYWSSESYKGYSDGWHIQVETLSSETPGQWVMRRKDSLECGSVRAVRTP